MVQVRFFIAHVTSQLGRFPAPTAVSRMLFSLLGRTYIHPNAAGPSQSHMSFDYFRGDIRVEGVSEYSVLLGAVGVGALL